MSTLLLVDGGNVFWRSYHALENKPRPEGTPNTWAVHGTIMVLAEHVKRWKPTHLLVAFDGGNDYRKSIFGGYKEHRNRNHEHDDIQLRQTISALKVLGVPTLLEHGVEADDIIAACVRKFAAYMDDIVILSGDKDLRQLVTWNVVVVQPRKKYGEDHVVWTVKEVRERYGVEPYALPELYALVGDVSDNIPGVPGIGEKTASRLLQKHGGILGVISSGDRRIVGRERQIAMSYRLFVLDGTVASCNVDERYLRWNPIPGESGLTKYLEQLGLDTIVRRWRDGSLWAGSAPSPKRRLRSTVS